ncbi:ATP-independent periplasmic protein-refolding chaperone [Erwinia sp. OLTSP20]|uniref:ATP-independent periplasmic protein-refolding chaperone Spy n=1 Tax=unclassified Erwinia TaxID=2622719 RepID=UPI000C174E84|nr:MULTISPECIES: ATP-independent periplasmic protein-refolding chaperone Spy [unclassified Erwinia]PIJ51862.1 ATP-independent periplasmic protein-refolding chaperone [Erwinia sp. OAMSP11]PIJ74450.1 ATP-independent periplasmic protein-refolding chaperone [Erwinia sp. OLSSP12]PIJ83717.1 ATP-independent periplasmic protein-refolding chaperone [Erwinia sp. OLCASP19]PIJ86760.1 ATP-independent periplasmic protein-refolding chaperone [Erwinia sp. OLMTSP26]PIJ88167.1 ATP-independent periplasmic protei
MRKLTSVIVATSLALGAANLVHAAADNLTPPPAGSEKPMMHKGPHHGMPDMWMYKNLNLTDAQKQQMRSIMKEAHKQMPRPSLEERREMHSIIAADSFDAAKADAQADKMASADKARMLKMMETQNKLYNVLTAEQKKQFNANFEKHLTDKPVFHQSAPVSKG